MGRPTSSDPGVATWHNRRLAPTGRDLFAGASLVERTQACPIDAHRGEGWVLVKHPTAPIEVHVIARLPDPHSALRTSPGLRRVTGFDARPVLELPGEPAPTARAAWRKRLTRRPAAMDWRLWKLARGLTLAKGPVDPLPPRARKVQGADGYDRIDRPETLRLGGRMACRR